MIKANQIVLVGMPRSGTTWIGKIFDSHPRVVYRHEPDDRHRLRGVPLFPLPAEDDRYQQTIESFCATILDVRDAKTAGSLPVFEKDFLSPAGNILRRRFIEIGKMTSRFVREVSIPKFVEGRLPADARLIWKSIHSLGRAGLFSRAMPDSHVVIVQRHPCGYVASVLRGEAQRKFTSSTAAWEDFGIYEIMAHTSQAGRRNLDLDIFRAMSPVQRLAWRWVVFNEAAVENVRGRGNVTVIRYEDLCRAPLEHVRALFDYCGLSWNAQTERFISDSIAKNNPAYYSVFKNSLQSAMKWQEELPRATIDEILDVIMQSDIGRSVIAGWN